MPLIASIKVWIYGDPDAHLTKSHAPKAPACISQCEWKVNCGATKSLTAESELRGSSMVSLVTPNPGASNNWRRKIGIAFSKGRV